MYYLLDGHFAEESLPQSFTDFLPWKGVESLSPSLYPQFHPQAEIAMCKHMPLALSSERVRKTS